MNLRRRIAMSQLIEPNDLEIEQPMMTDESAVEASRPQRTLRGITLEQVQEHEEQRFALERNAARRRSSGHMLRNKDFQ